MIEHKNYIQLTIRRFNLVDSINLRLPKNITENAHKVSHISISTFYHRTKALMYNNSYVVVIFKRNRRLHLVY